MYECPGCGQNLRFDIPSQMLKCTHCDSLYDPYQYNAGEDAKESVNFDVTVFTCPQCGAVCRVPKGKGRIVITCPRCGNEIHGKS